MSCRICVETAKEDCSTQKCEEDGQAPHAEVNQAVGLTRDSSAELVAQDTTDNTKERACLELATFFEIPKEKGDALEYSKKAETATTTADG